MTITINEIEENGKLVFSIQGRLDTTTAPQLQEMLIPAFDRAKRIELDFKEVAYVSSAGLRVLLLGEKTSKAKSVPMSLRNVSPDIMEVFDMTGFNDILTIE